MNTKIQITKTPQYILQKNRSTIYRKKHRNTKYTDTHTQITELQITEEQKEKLITG